VSIKKDILWRVGIVYMAILAFALFIVIKIITIQFIQKDRWIAKAEEISISNIPIPSNRGDILASDGKRLLASSVPYYEIRMDTRCDGLSDDFFYKNIDSLAIRLSHYFKDASAQQYKKKIVTARKKGNRFLLIKRRVNYLVLKDLKEFPIFREGRYKGGLIYLQEYKRIKPHNHLASRTIGVITESDTVVGVEGAYNDLLRGKEGQRLMQRLSGNVWMPIGDGNEIEPQDGYDVVTTIDINIQDVAENTLMQQLQKHSADHGTVVVMEVETGEIKAIANLKKGNDGHYYEMYNYAVGESSEPGSTFKLPIMIAALEDKVIDPNDSIDTEDGSYQVYDKKIKDSNYGDGGGGKISVKRAFEISSNVAMAKIVQENYKGKETKLIDRLYRMNLNEPLEIEIKGEGQPYVKYPNSEFWSGISLAMMSHGYEVRQTPLQTLTFYNAVANDGKMVKPMFVKELRKHGKIIKTFDTETINSSICSKSTLRKVHEMLEGVVENGTATNLKASSFKIAGKTGTAQLNYADKNKQLRHQASFVGYFPADNPKYSCIVVVNSPSRDVFYGNLVAGPVFLEIAEKVYSTNLDLHNALLAEEDKQLPYSKCGVKDETILALQQLEIPVSDSTTGNWVVTQKGEEQIALKNRSVIDNLVPNVMQMGLKDAVYLLESKGLKVKVVGRGSIKSQSIMPGSRIRGGETIVLEMSFIG
jgi:cell division protein FtsI (penicillin-binding protein 3)